ncbi:helix-turn-helix domain-containing protein [Archangium violaceum]|nr:helix-turn-helix domain-containing protein [Archangium violaceum]
MKDVSTYLQVSTSWVYQRSASGELPSLKIGGLLRFDPSAIRNWTGIS